jgi:hypothetical protein
LRRYSAVEEIPRVPIIATGNDFSTLYAPLIRDGRMDKFYWAPTFEDRVGVACGIFKTDGVEQNDVEVGLNAVVDPTCSLRKRTPGFQPSSC